jgi:UDP-N-acetylmuramoyl-L-alanyl-D-glutamate--2,6-diaminopimelate ligase
VEFTRLFARLADQGAMIERLSSDSRGCAPGVAFFAYPGERSDGRTHIPDALARGASAVLWEEKEFSWPSQWRIPNAGVRDLKQCAGQAAHEFYGRPSESLWVCGVTGTNGKTSCSQWIAALLQRAGIATGVIGTLGAGFPGRLRPVSNTTPDALDIHGLLKGFVAEGARAVAMEVSSHGLVQGRVNAVAFDCALFTNLSHDHLDYHGSMEAYAQAKGRLFDMPGIESAVLNLDDVLGVRLAQRLAARGVRTIGYSLSRSAVAPSSVGQFIAAEPAGSLLRIQSTWGTAEVQLSQLGRFNVSNALGVLGCLVSRGLPFGEAASLLAGLPAVPGRMEKISDRPLVVVDYAHTPDALEKVLQALRPVADRLGGRLVAVFGAGGERDASKRPLMGAVASRLADAIVLTSDNPRSEDPQAIISQIESGVSCEHQTQVDRARAIEQAIAHAGPSGVVLIAGKGHESYQDAGGSRVPFSDADVVRRVLHLERPQ